MRHTVKAAPSFIPSLDILEEEVNIMVHKTNFVKNQAKDFSRQIWAVCNYNH
tara:strand:- start:50 stop:205 length:156 start_codon:yes stop_codon:yes gene_type:complete